MAVTVSTNPVCITLKNTQYFLCSCYRVVAVYILLYAVFLARKVAQKMFLLSFQVLYMDAVEYFPDDLQETLDLMTEKELRVRVPMEELDLLLEI